MSRSRRIILTTFGSFGDLHPYMAVALELRARGHRPVIATSAYYQDKIEAEGIGFHPLRPDVAADNKAIVRPLMDQRKGTERVVREMVMPHPRDTYADLTAVVRGADLLVTHPLVYAGPLVAQKTGVPWISSVLAPIMFLSAYDPPVLSQLPRLARLRKLGPWINGMVLGFGRFITRHWAEPVRQLRKELGLDPGGNPLFEGQHSPHRVLALFSSVLAEPQPDWPPQTRITGFPFYDRRERDAAMPADLSRFLQAGPPPIVFTLGSSAVMDAGDFYEQSIEAARRLGRRAVLLVGKDPANRPRGPLPEGVAVTEYAPYSEIFPRAAAIVHQGGIGTTAQALRAGRPMLIMPYSHDQPDNAARITRLGVGRGIDRRRYTAGRAARELNRLLSDPGLIARAEEIGRRVRAENGAATACDLIEAELGHERILK